MMQGWHFIPVRCNGSQPCLGKHPNLSQLSAPVRPTLPCRKMDRVQVVCAHSR